MGDAPPFLVKTYDLVSDPNNSAVVGWGPNDSSFIVRDVRGYAMMFLDAMPWN